MKRHAMLRAAALLLLCTGASAAPGNLAPAEQAAAFKAAGFKQKGKQWRACEDPGTPSYAAGAIEELRDLNGDGRLEALITEGSAFCYGDVGAYWLVSKQASGSWTLVANGTGMVSFLAAKGAGAWPDMQVGGPGFCFPVLRWNGKTYALHRHEYEGKPCKRK